MEVDADPVSVTVGGGSGASSKSRPHSLSPASRDASTDEEDVVEVAQRGGGGEATLETKAKEEDGGEEGGRGDAASGSSGADGGERDDDGLGSDGGSDIDEADIEEALRHLDAKDRKIIALMAELEEVRGVAALLCPCGSSGVHDNYLAFPRACAGTRAAQEDEPRSVSDQRCLDPRCAPSLAPSSLVFTLACALYMLHCVPAVPPSSTCAVVRRRVQVPPFPPRARWPGRVPFGGDDRGARGNE